MNSEDYDIREIRLLEDMRTRFGTMACFSKSEREYYEGYYEALKEEGKQPPPEIYEPME